MDLKCFLDINQVVFWSQESYVKCLRTNWTVMLNIKLSRSCSNSYTLLLVLFVQIKLYGVLHGMVSYYCTLVYSWHFHSLFSRISQCRGIHSNAQYRDVRFKPKGQINYNVLHFFWQFFLKRGLLSLIYMPSTPTPLFGTDMAKLV